MLRVRGLLPSGHRGGAAALLAATAVMAVPAAAQAAVPEIKRFPKLFSNSVKLGKTHKATVTFGAITLENETLKNLACRTLAAGETWNETTEGTEKGLVATVGYTTYACKAENPCRVINTKGEEVEGYFLTAEAPPRAEGTEAHPTGISSLPWTGEVIERETGVTQVLTHKVKLWLVFPPPGVGKGLGCVGTEIPFEDQEGPAEKDAGDELAPLWVNGSKNGLHPSVGVLEGELGKTEKGFPQTGRLISPALAGGALYPKAPSLITGSAAGFFELITAE
jgi:hypothetical protein